MVFNDGPRKWVQPGCHGRRRQAQDCLHNAVRNLRVQQNADGFDQQSRDLSEAYANLFERLHLSDTACVPG